MSKEKEEKKIILFPDNEELQSLYEEYKDIDLEGRYKRENYIDTNPIVPLTRKEWDEYPRDLTLNSKNIVSLQHETSWVFDHGSLFEMFEKAVFDKVESPPRRDIFPSFRVFEKYSAGNGNFNDTDIYRQIYSSLGFPEHREGFLKEVFKGHSTSLIRIQMLDHNKALIFSFMPFKDYPDLNLPLDYSLKHCGRVRKVISSFKGYIKQTTITSNRYPNEYVVPVPVRADIVELSINDRFDRLTTLPQEIYKQFYKIFVQEYKEPVDYPKAFFEWLELSFQIYKLWYLNIHRFNLNLECKDEDLVLKELGDNFRNMRFDLDKLSK